MRPSRARARRPRTRLWRRAPIAAPRPGGGGGASRPATLPATSRAPPAPAARLPARQLPAHPRPRRRRDRALTAAAGSAAAERNEDRYARRGPDLARDVALARPVFRDEDVAGAEAAHCAVTDLDVHRARQREDGVSARSVVPRIRAPRIEPPHDDAAARNQLRGRGCVAAVLEAQLEVLEMRL